MTRSPMTPSWSARCRTQRLSQTTTSPGAQRCRRVWPLWSSARTSSATVRRAAASSMPLTAAQRAGVVRYRAVRPQSGCSRKRCAGGGLDVGPDLHARDHVPDRPPGQRGPQIVREGVVCAVLVGEQRFAGGHRDSHRPQRRVRGRGADIAGVDVERAPRRCRESDVADDVQVREPGKGRSPAVNVNGPRRRRKVMNPASSSRWPRRTTTPYSASSARIHAMDWSSRTSAWASRIFCPKGLEGVCCSMGCLLGVLGGRVSRAATVGPGGDVARRAGPARTGRAGPCQRPAPSRRARWSERRSSTGRPPGTRAGRPGRPRSRTGCTTGSRARRGRCGLPPPHPLGQWARGGRRSSAVVGLGHESQAFAGVRRELGVSGAHRLAPGVDIVLLEREA